MIPSDIKTARLALGLTQQALADKVGVRGLEVWRWESGKGKPSWKNQQRLEKVLNQQGKG